MENEKPNGLRGWLILPAIFLVTTPFNIGATLVRDFLPIFRDGGWALFTTPGSEFYHPYWAPGITLEVVGNILLIVFSVTLIFLFFSKSYRFPLLFIIFISANFIFVLCDTFLAYSIPALEARNDPGVLKELIRSVVYAAVWIPYFLISKRVKNTFVKDEPKHVADVFS